MYIGSQHLRARPDAASDSEPSRCERQSYLSEVPGFQSFHLLRGAVEEGARVYASHTVWSDEAAFMAWTQSDAFRKAHAQGGKTVALLMGPPRFAGWESVEL